MRDNNNDEYIEDSEIDTDKLVSNDAKNKPHVVRRNIEDLLERQALRKRLKDIYDDDFLMD